MSASSALHNTRETGITVTNDASTTAEVVVAGYRYMVLYLPSGLNATALTLHSAIGSGSTSYAAYNSSTALSHTVAASRAVRIDVEGFNTIKLVSNNGTPDTIPFSLQSN